MKRHGHLHNSRENVVNILLGDSKLDPNDPRNAALLEVTKVCTYMYIHTYISVFCMYVCM